MSNTVLIHGAAGSLVLTNRDDWKAHALPTARKVLPFSRAMREAGGGAMTSCSVCAKPRQRPTYGRADSYCHCGVAAAPTHCAACGLALEPMPYSSDRSRCKCRAVAPISAASAATSAGVASGSNALQIASAVLTLSYVSTAASASVWLSWWPLALAEWICSSRASNASVWSMVRSCGDEHGG